MNHLPSDLLIWTCSRSGACRQLCLDDVFTPVGNWGNKQKYCWDQWKFSYKQLFVLQMCFFRCPGWLNRPNFPRKIEAPSNGLLPFMEQRQSWSWNSWKAWYQWPQRHYAPFFLHQQVWLQLENKHRRFGMWNLSHKLFNLQGPPLMMPSREQFWSCILRKGFGGIGALVLSSMKRMSMKRKSTMASPCPFIVTPRPFIVTQACRTSGLRLGFFGAFLPIIRRVDRMPTWKQPEIHWLRGSYGIGLTRARFCRQGGPRWMNISCGEDSVHITVHFFLFISCWIEQTDR